MSKQLEITQVTIGPPRPTAPPKLLCYASIVLCGCFEVGGIRLVTHARPGQARLHFPYTLRIDPTGSPHRREQAYPTNPATRSMIEWVVLRAYRDWLDTNAAQGRYHEVLVKEVVS